MTWCSKCADFHAGEACGDLEVVIPEGTTWLEKSNVVSAPKVVFNEPTATCLNCLEKDRRIEELEASVGMIVKRRKWNRDYQRRRRNEAKQGQENRQEQKAV